MFSSIFCAEITENTQIWHSIRFLLKESSQTRALTSVTTKHTTNNSSEHNLISECLPRTFQAGKVEQLGEDKGPYSKKDNFYIFLDKYFSLMQPTTNLFRQFQIKVFLLTLWAWPKLDLIISSVSILWPYCLWWFILVPIMFIFTYLLSIFLKFPWWNNFAKQSNTLYKKIYFLSSILHQCMYSRFWSHLVKVLCLIESELLADICITKHNDTSPYLLRKSLYIGAELYID